MAGDLTFLRAPRGGFEDLRSASLAILGAPFEKGSGARAGQRLGPRILRETSVYFGWHANPQFHHPIDIDARRRIDTSSIHGRLIDLGDAPMADRPPDEALAILVGCLDRISSREAGVIVLGGDGNVARASARDHPLVTIGGEVRGGERLCLAPATPIASEAARQLRRSGGRVLGIADLRNAGCDEISRMTEAVGRPFVHLDLSAVAAPLSGMSLPPRLTGLDHAVLYRVLTAIGRASVAGLAVSGLDPTLHGLSIVKTGPRLLVAALLGFIYGYMGLAEEVAVR
jgi:agmatinase